MLAEARWLAEEGVKEVFLVSENTSSYGKDLADLRPPVSQVRVWRAAAGDACVLDLT